MLYVAVGYKPTAIDLKLAIFVFFVFCQSVQEHSLGKVIGGNGVISYRWLPTLQVISSPKISNIWKCSFQLQC